MVHRINRPYVPGPDASRCSKEASNFDDEALTRHVPLGVNEGHSRPRQQLLRPCISGKSFGAYHYPLRGVVAGARTDASNADMTLVLDLNKSRTCETTLAI